MAIKKDPKTHICLNMIVKDEAKLILRCLDSVLPFIDSWVIVDTGSTDGTQDIIKNHLAHLPGVLHEKPWVNFGHNRTEAADLAAEFCATLPDCDPPYLLFIDADDRMEQEGDVVMNRLVCDAYQLWLQLGAVTRYTRMMLVSTRKRWRWVGAVHEYPESTTAIETRGTIRNVTVISSTEGARSSDPLKYQKDAEMLEKELEKDPTNTRNQFYYAQSLRDAGSNLRSMEEYQKRATMEGFDEEVWFSLFQVGKLQERMGFDAHIVQESYLAAFDKRPHRAEPLIELARMARERTQWARARMYAEKAVACNPGNDILFLDRSAFEWRGMDELAIACYWCGMFEVSRDICLNLLKSGALPENQVERVKANMQFAINNCKTK